MKVYLRLLLVGAILCVALGIHQAESGNKVSTNHKPGAIEHVVLQKGLLPFKINDPPVPEGYRIALDQRNSYTSYAEYSERLLSSRTAIRFLNHRMDFNNIKHELNSGTGQFMHRSESREYPA